MRIRIDLKILIFFMLFYITNQIHMYLMIMGFCIIHELGHMMIGYILKMKPEKLEIIPCGLAIAFKVNVNDINIKVKKGNLLELKNVIVAMAGPVVTAILIIFYRYFAIIHISVQEALYANILILLFNLIPLYPLDGGRIIKGILHIQYGSKQAKYISNKISNITMIILTVMSSISIYYFKNIAIFLICIFLWSITLHENKIFKNNMKMYDLLEKN